MCHRVLNDSDFSRTRSLPGMVVRARTFERLTAHIAKTCEVVDLSTASPGTSDRQLRVAFTFDDGWSDNLETALPIAAARGIPLTIFICPGLMDRISPFWPEQLAALYLALHPAAAATEIETAIEKLKAYSPEERETYLSAFSGAVQSASASAEPCDADRTLSWEQIRVMDRAGVRFGSHTFSHQILTTISEPAVREEVRQSRAEIEHRLGKPCAAFAYPNGDWSSATGAILAAEGYEFALTTDRDVWAADCDRLAIPRLSISEDNLVGWNGNFSRARFEYTTFWKTWWARKRRSLVKRLRART